MTIANGKFADHFGPFAGRCWFDTAHQGPMPRVAVQAATEALAQRIRPHEIQDADFFDVPGRLRQTLGELVGADPKDIILGNSTTYGIDLLANGIRWERETRFSWSKETCQPTSLRGLFFSRRPGHYTRLGVTSERAVQNRLAA